MTTPRPIATSSGRNHRPVLEGTNTTAASCATFLWDRPGREILAPKGKIRHRKASSKSGCFTIESARGSLRLAEPPLDAQEGRISNNAYGYSRLGAPICGHRLRPD